MHVRALELITVAFDFRLAGFKLLEICVPVNIQIWLCLPLKPNPFTVSEVPPVAGHS